MDRSGYEVLILKWISPKTCKLLFVVLTSSLVGSSHAHARPPVLSLKTQIKDGSPLRLAAEQLNYLPGKGKILLRGNVRLTAGTLRIHAKTMTALLDAHHRPIHLDARGGFTFSLKGVASGKAEQGVLLLGKQRLTLSGNASLALDKGLELRGQQISMDLHSRRVTVHKARARLHLDGS